MPIQINKATDRFFMAIAKQGIHSFLLLGVHDANNVRHLLCRVGKAGCLLSAQLKDEGLYRNQGHTVAISYQAYEVTYKQYCEFVRVLEGLHTETNAFHCFKPLSEENDIVVMEQTNRVTFPAREALGDLRTSTGKLGPFNTCRHTAIKLVEEVQQHPLSSSSSTVSSLFFRQLPCTTTLVAGSPSQDTPFYVLPVSPAAYPQLSAQQKFTLEKLYHRMETLLLLDPHSEQTQKKFSSLKELYETVLGSQVELGLDALLGSIQHWKQAHQPIIGVLRRQYIFDSFFTRKSTTEKLIDEIENELKPPSQDK